MQARSSSSRSQHSAAIVLTFASLALPCSAQEPASCELWADWNDGSAFGGEELGTDIVADPDGGLVFTTGRVLNASYDLVTIAYDQESGLRKWTATYDG